MIRSAAALRALLDQPLPNTLYTRRAKARLLRECATHLHRDAAQTRRCRSVREQYEYDHRVTDGLPPWL
jgi:hypothetical protein